jgi:predicted amidohydrolase
MVDKIIVSAVQTNPVLMAKEINLRKIVDRTKEAARNGALLIVFPECALTGYVFCSREEAIPFAEAIPGPSTKIVSDICREFQVYVVFGLLEKERHKYYNSAAFVGPKGLIGTYRKAHLPRVERDQTHATPVGNNGIAVDVFMDRSTASFRVYATPIGNIGIMICYDNSFPETARILSLLGAEIIAMPTNWGEGDIVVNKLMPSVRAFENGVNLIAADRVGIERGERFPGESKIIDPKGRILAEAGAENEEIVYAEISLSQAREKHTIIGKKEYGFVEDKMRDRCPELYDQITKKLCSVICPRS